jgi:late competence protein required for DNA uptake (superfamily II DNA/RNA helicase)
MESVPWGDILVCQNCIEMLGVDEVKNLVGIAVKEKSFEASNAVWSSSLTPDGEGGFVLSTVFAPA